MNQYDEIKSLLKKSRLMLEQSAPVNIDQDTEQEMDIETTPTEDKVKTYRVSGGIIKLHGKNQKDLELTGDEKVAFQETMDEFVDEVSDLTDFGVLNVYPNNVEWSGKVLDYDVEFMFSIGENNGVYINGDMIKLDAPLLDFVNKLSSYYDKFKSKWAKILSQRKNTNLADDSELA